MSGTVLPDRTLIRLGAVSAVLGVVVLIGGNAIHGGDDPANLAVSLPQYAANGNWVVAHILQFLGFLLILGGLVALHRSIPAEPGAALARMGLVTALVAVGVYGANQAVDGIAIKFVAEEWMGVQDLLPASSEPIGVITPGDDRNLHRGRENSTVNFYLTLVLKADQLLLPFQLSSLVSEADISTSAGKCSGSLPGGDSSTPTISAPAATSSSVTQPAKGLSFRLARKASAPCS